MHPRGTRVGVTLRSNPEDREEEVASASSRHARIATPTDMSHRPVPGESGTLGRSGCHVCSHPLPPVAAFCCEVDGSRALPCPSGRMAGSMCSTPLRGAAAPDIHTAEVDSIGCGLEALAEDSSGRGSPSVVCVCACGAKRLMGCGRSSASVRRCGRRASCAFESGGRQFGHAWAAPRPRLLEREVLALPKAPPGALG